MMEVKSDDAKNSIAQEPGMLGFRSDLGLEVIKEEMASMNINILEIGELKWTGMD